MKKYIVISAIALLAGVVKANAQYGSRVYISPGYARSYHHPRRQAVNSGFRPSLNIAVGYGFPNLDKNYLGAFTNANVGNYNQTGPISGSVDYQFSPYTSIGIMGTYGKVSAPYYDAFTNTQAFTGSLDNVSVMLNLVNYFPTYNNKVSPYVRTAIGVNNWSQNYTTSNGGKITDVPQPNEFAYQVSLGVKFHLSNNTSLFMEAGYGKYILAGGLSFKL